MRIRARGVTLVEVLISLMLITVGLSGLIAALSSAIHGGMRAARLTQAQQRAMSLIEAIRRSSAQTLACLSATESSSWASCEATCIGGLSDPGAQRAQACILTTASMALLPGPPAGPGGVSNQAVDRNGQAYSLYANPADPGRSSFVRQTGPGGRIYDVRISVGWNDDGSASTTAPQRMVTLRTGFFR